MAMSATVKDWKRLTLLTEISSFRVNGINDMQRMCEFCGKTFV